MVINAAVGETRAREGRANEEGDFARRVPPRGRDFQVYRLTAVEGLSTREAAAAVGLSQTRVVQLRERVVEWMAEELPTLETKSPEQRLLAAEYLAVQRMEFLYGRSLAAWRKSQGPETVERRSGVTGDTSTITRMSHGNVRYLQQAMRVAKELAKFPLRSLPAALDEIDDSEASDAQPGRSSPLKEDCSAAEDARHEVARDNARDNDANLNSDYVCESFDSGILAANVIQLREKSPVQSAECGDSNGPKLGASRTPLNRHQRRARQRRLETALKRKAK